MSGSREHLSSALASSFKWACLSELEALKPGNVHIYADGHNMVVEDFLKSAEASAEVIAQPGLPVGKRILLATEKTWDAVGCNTNLGILLLCAPLAHAVLYGSGASLRDRLRDVLSKLTVQDATAAFHAISKANPAGLGESSRHDVRSEATISLRDAMVAAQARDRIAWQYAHDFSDVFDVGLPRFDEFLHRWQWTAWATTGLYLEFLSRYPDSHIARKYGEARAKQVQADAAAHAREFATQENPKLYLPQLRKFDQALKHNGLNPGTSADLTVATLFSYAAHKLLKEKG